MTYVLNDTVALTTEKTAVAQGPTFWPRLYAAMIESRRRSASRELRARHFLLNEAEIVLGGFPQASLKDDARLPFNR